MDDKSNHCGEASTQPQIQRRSFWQGSLDAIRYIGELHNDRGVKLRKIDKLTTGLLGLAVLVGSLCIFYPHFGAAIVFSSDLLGAAALSLYLSSRLGAITYLPPRQAFLIGELLFGMFVTGVFITLNILGILLMIRNSVILP